MTPDESELWERISSFVFDDPTAARPFSARVARENGWSTAFTAQAIEEYRRFAFLAAISAEPVSPSEVVDRVWHEHLLYTRNYWDDFCAKTLGKRLHHEPSRGGTTESVKFAAWYRRTLADYRRYFGEPSLEFWPPAADAKPSPGEAALSRVGRWIRRKLSFGTSSAAVGVIGTLLVLGCTTGGHTVYNPLDFTGPDFLAFWIPLTAICALVAIALRWRARKAIAAVHRLSDPVEVALIAGGLERVAASVIAGLYRRGLIIVEKRKLKSDGQLPANAAPTERVAFDVCAAGISRLSELTDALRAMVQPQIDALMEAKLLVDDETTRRIRTMTLLCMSVPVVLGVSKLVVGIVRDRPVGFLIVGLVVTLVLTYFAARRPLRTTAGDTALENLRSANDDLAPSALDITRLPDPTSASMAVALFGAAVLPGMAMSALQPLFGVTDSDTSGGSGCGGGGGGGGGGCGGCGGH